MTMKTKCQTTTGPIECDTEYPDFFRTTYVRSGVVQVRTECLNHATASEVKGRLVELIDMR